ncbi:hypothetical protein [Sandarakinorhabdus sp.]|uniref:hypothetical protein n=1 Tax=Sandarakinorhabdus sp. TaxID=1916663 RepID=UPI003F6E51E7
MADPFDSPVDVAADGAGVSGLTQMAAAVSVALFCVAMLNAHALAAWADGLTPSARTAGVVAVSHGLADRTAARGLDGPRAAIKARWDQAKAARWRGQSEDQR